MSALPEIQNAFGVGVDWTHLTFANGPGSPFRRRFRDYIPRQRYHLPKGPLAPIEAELLEDRREIFIVHNDNLIRMTFDVAFDLNHVLEKVCHEMGLLKDVYLLETFYGGMIQHDCNRTLQHFDLNENLGFRLQRKPLRLKEDPAVAYEDLRRKFCRGEYFLSPTDAEDAFLLAAISECISSIPGKNVFNKLPPSPEAVDGDSFDAFGTLYVETGRPGLPKRISDSVAAFVESAVHRFPRDLVHAIMVPMVTQSALEHEWECVIRDKAIDFRGVAIEELFYFYALTIETLTFSNFDSIPVLRDGEELSLGFSENTAWIVDFSNCAIRETYHMSQCADYTLYNETLFSPTVTSGELLVDRGKMRHFLPLFLSQIQSLNSIYGHHHAPDDGEFCDFETVSLERPTPSGNTQKKSNET